METPDNKSSFSHLIEQPKFFLPRMTNVFNIYGHNGCVNCIKWSHDGSLLISGSDDGTLKIWDMTKNSLKSNGHSTNCKNTLNGHISNVFSVEMQPAKPLSAAKIISGGNDSTLRIFDLKTGTNLHILRQFQKKICSISAPKTCFNTFIASSADGTVRHYDMREKFERCNENIGENKSNRILPQIFGGGFAQENQFKSIKNLLLDFSTDERNRYGVHSVDIHPLNASIFVVSIANGNSYLYDMRKISNTPLKSFINSYRNYQL
ncbi:hypothetical protein MHBO_001434, partial [Bonamia ostreae]